MTPLNNNSNEGTNNLLYKGVFIRRRQEDDLISISDMWKAEEKPRYLRPDLWIKSRSVQSKLKAIAELQLDLVGYYPNGSINAIPGVLQIVRGGHLGTQGVFANLELAIGYADFLGVTCGQWARQNLIGFDPLATLTPEVISSLIQSEKEFPVDFDDAMVWWDARTKDGKPIRRDNLVDKLKAEFKEGLEYHLLKNQEVVLRPQGGGSGKDKYYLTLDCFKMMGMMVSGEQGRRIRMYFIDCEKRLKQLLSRTVPLERQIVYSKQRLDARENLKDNLRKELVSAALVYIRAAKLNPIKVLSEMHDTINERLQGIRAREVRNRNGFSKSTLLRDYYEKHPLDEVSVINQLGANYIKRYNLHPVEAIHKACDDFLKDDHVPHPFLIVENVYAQGRRLMAALERKRLSQDSRQLELPLWNEG